MKTIEQYIETEMSGKIAIKRNSPLPALLVLAVGIGTMALLRIVKMGDSLSATCLTVGFICTAIGFLLTAINLSGASTHFEYLPTNSRMCDKKVYVNGDDYMRVVESVGKADIHPLLSISPVVSSNYALRVLVSRDGKCALVQPVRDQSGRFEPETEVCVVTGQNAAGLIRLTE